MSIGRRGSIALAIAAVLLVAGWAVFERYWYYIPALIVAVTQPIAPNHPVVWLQGPRTPPLPSDNRPPNVILILADDLGFNDITVNGGGVAGGAVPTPNIDSIARTGVMFTNGYAGNATCAPSRAAIMTGRYGTRFGFEFTPTPPKFENFTSQPNPDRLHQSIYYGQYEDLVPPMAQQSVPTSEITIAQMMHSRGYRTLFLGKWHLGQTEATRPESRGFDDALGFLGGGSAYLPQDAPNVVNSYQDFDPIDKFVWSEIRYFVTFDRSPIFRPSEYMTDYLGDEAVKAIDANANRPFFMYWAPNAPHIPLQALKSDYDALPQITDHRLRVYAAMIRALDRNVGKILAALKRDGLDKNTLVIFTSDNGGAGYLGLPNINRPYRGWKMTFFEGGIHVPFFMKWPNVIHPDTIYRRPVGHVDIFATAAAVAGARLPSDRVIDGVNLIPYILGSATGIPHETLFWRSGHYRSLLNDGWKLQVSATNQGIWLFDLATDPTERHNLAAINLPELNIMLKKLDVVDRQQMKPLWPQLVDAAIDIDHPLSVPETKQDEFVYWGN